MPPRTVFVAASLLPLILAGCSQDAESKRGLHGQRNLACLHSMRDTEEGYDAAIATLQGVVASDEATFVDWLNLARAFVLHPKRAAEAGAAIEKAAALGGDVRGKAALSYVRGLHRNAKDYAAAHDAFEEVLAAIPDHPEALYQSGYAAERAGELDVARQRYERLLELQKLVRPAAYRLSRVAVMLRDEALGARAIAVFQSRDKDEKPEVTKCGLTDLTMRRFNRVDVEPPVLELKWQDPVPVRMTGKVQQVVPCPGATPGVVDLFLLGEGEVAVSIDGGPAAATGVALQGAACGVVLDVDNKGGPEFVVADARGFAALAREGGRWTSTEVEFPAYESGAPVAMRAFDIDHDGDVDILATIGGEGRSLAVLRNKGDGGFTWQTPFAARMAVTAGRARFDAHDLDQANDLDIVFPAGEAGATALLNLRGEKFRPVPLPAFAGRPILIAEDFDNDGAPDLFGAGGEPGYLLASNADVRGRPYEVRFLPAKVAPSGVPVATDAVPADIDNDGDLDVLLGTAAGLVVVRNTRGGQLVPNDTLKFANGIQRLAVADLRGDGDLDVIAIDGEGVVMVVRPSVADRYEAIVVAPEGRKDNRRAIGTVVQMFADRSFQSRMLKSPFGVRFGLGKGGLAAFDGLRLRWPQGILQAVPRNRIEDLSHRIVFKQIEGMVASCPFLYSYGVDGWEFVSDVIGIAPLDEWRAPDAGPGHMDPEEFVRIAGDRLVVRDGKVQLAITEELKETAYLDRVELLYADHGADEELLLDENIVTQGKYDPLRVQTFGRAQFAPLAAAVARGENQLDRVAAQDRVYAYPYTETLSQWGGWTEPHTFDLTTSAPATVLLLEGRIAWYDSTVSFSLHQNGRTFQPMRLERVLANGSTEVLVADAGMPTGMDRTMILSLGEEFPAGTKLRLTAQYRFLWDRIRTATAPSLEQPAVGVAALSAAELYHHGYSAYLGDPATHAQSYEFEAASPDDRYPRAQGLVNEYGDVRSLLSAHDDRLAILVAGDAVRMQFDAPPVPAGKTRTWFLRVTGWAKEGSFHNLTGKRVVPLPFRGMSAYPPPVGEASEWTDAAEVLTRRIR